jgi:hypothetical protein
MDVGLKDMDPRIAEAFAGHVRARLVATEPTAAPTQADDVPRQSARTIPGWLTMAFPFAGFALIMGGIPFVETLPALTIGMWAASFATSFATVTLLGRKADPVPRLRQSVSLDQMRSVFSKLTLSRAERLYCDTLLLLAEGEQKASTVDGPGILSNLNSLLDSSRNLETQRERILAALGAASVETLEQERDNLVQQTVASDDPVVRADLQTSRALCDARLEDARALERSLKRIDAQQQVVFQTLASVQSSLMRRQLSEAPLAVPEFTTLQQSVTEIGYQTRAVEQAVQEVVSLRGS